MKNIKGVIDIEPKCVDILRLTTSENLKEMRPDLEKAMKIADIVRQAQKKNKTIIFFPNGKMEEK